MAMADLFLKVLNMSLSAGWLVLAVLVLRLALGKAPKWIHVLLWGMVAVRLVCPFTLESVLSLIPSPQVVSPSIMMEAEPQIHSGVEFINSTVNPILSQVFAPTPEASVNPLQILIPVGGGLWLAGMFAMLLYAAVSYFRLERQVRDAFHREGCVYVSQKVTSPFILGFIRPRVYLPANMDAQTQACVMAHELSHIRRRDHWWKPLGFLLLSVHWFNPLMWVAYILLCRDIEMACDEKVIRFLGTEQRADYSQALLQCSISGRAVTACPLAFGEVSVKQRIQSVLRYKKPGFWLVLISLLLCAVLAVCFLTDPKDDISAYKGKSLAVWIQDGDSAHKGEIRWNFFDVRKFRNVTLPGANPVKISLEEITEAGVRISLDREMLCKDKTLKAFFLNRNDSVVVMTPTAGGASWYGFSLVDDSSISLSSSAPLESLPADYSLEQAKKDGCVVMEDGDVTCGKDTWWYFYQKVQEEKPASVRYVTWFSLGDPSRYGSAYYEEIKDSYPRMYVHDLLFDGSTFHVTWYEEGVKYHREYPYLLRLTGEVESKNVAYSSYERYVLTGKKVSTWTEIMNSCLSSQMGVAIDHMTVYENLIYPDEPTYGDLYAAQKALEPYMRQFGIVSLGINEITWTLDIGVKDAVAGLEDMVAQWIDPGYVRVIQMEGEIRFTDSGNAQMTLEDVLKLSEKKMELTWDDLAPYERYDIGSGLIVCRFDIDPSFYLLVGDSKLMGEPMYARLYCYDGSYVDIRTDDVNLFLSDKNNGLLSKEISALLEEICSSPLESSAPGAYIDAHPEAYEKLLSYGSETLRWCFARFMEGQEAGLPGHIMAIACEEIMFRNGEAYPMDSVIRMTGQDWFDEFYSLAKGLKQHYGEKHLREDYPGAWLVLNLSQ